MIPAGSLSEFSLSDLLQILKLEEATGTLRFVAPGKSAAFEAISGTLKAAICGPKLGNEAVYAVFLWEEGRFAWDPSQSGGIEGPVTEPLADLTREGISRRDSWRDARRILPSLNAMYRSKGGQGPQPGWPAEVLRAWSELDAGVSIGDLGRAMGISPVKAASILVFLWQCEALEAQIPQAERSWLLFRRIISSLFQRFAEISGLKMTDALKALLHEQAAANGLTIRFEELSVADEDGPSRLPSEACKRVLAAVIRHISQLHGSSFVDRIVAACTLAEGTIDVEVLDSLGLQLPASIAGNPPSSGVQ